MTLVLKLVFYTLLTLFLGVVGYLFIFPLFYGAYPEFFGHYDFYTQCKKIKAGTPLQEVRLQMAQYLEAGKSWSPSAPLPEGLFSATAMGVSETSSENRSRIIFIPNSKDIADWCMVYPANGKVVRVEISPD